MRISNAQCPLSKWRLFEEIRNFFYSSRNFLLILLSFHLGARITKAPQNPLGGFFGP